MIGLDLAALGTAVDEALYESGWCQRTTERRHSWRHVSEGGFDRRRYKVARLKWKDAKAFIERHHYSGSFASAKLRYGMYRGDRLVGVAVLGSPMSEAVLTNPLPTLDQTTAAEWNRLVILDEVDSNGDSARCCISCNKLILRSGQAGRRVRNSISR